MLIGRRCRGRAESDWCKEAPAASAWTNNILTDGPWRRSIIAKREGPDSEMGNAQTRPSANTAIDYEEDRAKSKGEGWALMM